MNKETNFVDVMLIVLGKEDYYQLSREIAEECHKWNVSFSTFAEDILNKFCFIIFMVGMSKKIEIEKYKFKTDSKTFEMDSISFAKKFEKYIKKIENKKFEIAKSMI
ncbi:MAG: hypothetical protein HFJ29_00925 [Clostridia bacterium]|nr:hypothetical protein [Clostridia bacterium]